MQQSAMSGQMSTDGCSFLCWTFIERCKYISLLILLFDDRSLVCLKHVFWNDGKYLFL